MLSNACKYAIRSVLYLSIHATENEKFGVKLIAEKLETPQPNELAMLDTAKSRKDTSRLGCQILASWEMEGMEVHLPEEQGSLPQEG